MLWSIDALRGYTVRATDGEIGRAEDFLFDDRSWSVVYMVLETSKWLVGRRLLIAREAIGELDSERRRLPVALTKEKIGRSPELDRDAPVSRQHETDLHNYYGWLPYWRGATTVGLPAPDVEASAPERHRDGNPHLRSAHEITGYHIAAEDGTIGHVEDFLVDPGNWQIRYLIVDTRNWLPGKKVIIAPAWARAIRWADREVDVALTREQIRNSPEYDPAKAVSRGYETDLYRHYEAVPYWT